MKKGQTKKQPQDQQPPEWEALLSEVTFDLDYHEAPWDPGMLDSSPHQLNNPAGWAEAASADEERRRQIALVHKIARSKLRGLPRKSVQLLLLTGAPTRQIATMLAVSDDAVQRALKKAVRIIRETVHNQPGHFPTPRKKRPTVRAALFPLDTAHERQRFQEFISEHTVVQLAYRGNDPMREALVIFLTGQPNQRAGQPAPQ